MATQIWISDSAGKKSVKEIADIAAAHDVESYSFIVNHDVVTRGSESEFPLMRCWKGAELLQNR